MKKGATEIVKDPNSAYHNRKEYRSSTGLKGATKNMLNWKLDQEAGFKRKSHFDFGSLVHCLYLEPETLEEVGYKYDPKDAKSGEFYKSGAKKGQEKPLPKEQMEFWLQDLAEEKAKQGYEFLYTSEDLVKALEMKETAFRQHIVRKYFMARDMIPEQSFYTEMGFIHPVLNKEIPVMVKCRPDLMLPIKEQNRIFIIDVKTTGQARGAEEGAFKKIVNKLEYHQSAAWYEDIIKTSYKEVGGWESRADIEWAWFVQETVPPYNYNLIWMPNEWRIEGRKMYEAAIHNILYSEYNDFYGSWFEMSNTFGLGSILEEPSKWDKKIKKLQTDL